MPFRKTGAFCKGELELSCVEKNRATPKIVLSLTEDDLRCAQYLHTLDAYRRAPMLVRLSLMWGLLVGFFVFYEHRIGTPWPSVRALLPSMGLLVAVLLPVARLMVSLITCRIVARRCFRQDKTFQLPFSVTWDQEAFEVERPGSSFSRVAWRDYLKWRESRHVFLFYFSDCLFYILPKRVLTSSQIEDIRARLSVRRASET